MSAVNIPSPNIDGATLLSNSSGVVTWATLTQGVNTTITNASNSITIAAAGGGGTGNPEWFGTTTVTPLPASTGTFYSYNLNVLNAEPNAGFAYGAAARMAWPGPHQTQAFLGFAFYARPVVGNCFGPAVGTTTYFGRGRVYAGPDPFVLNTGQGYEIRFPQQGISAGISGIFFVATALNIWTTFPPTSIDWAGAGSSLGFGIDLEQAVQALP